MQSLTHRFLSDLYQRHRWVSETHVCRHWAAAISGAQAMGFSRVGIGVFVVAALGFLSVVIDVFVVAASGFAELSAPAGASPARVFSSFYRRSDKVWRMTLPPDFAIVAALSHRILRREPHFRAILQNSYQDHPC